MEFPDVGKQCHLSSCRQLDFLPFTCDACNQIFCIMYQPPVVQASTDVRFQRQEKEEKGNEHVAYGSHGCPESFKKDRRVPVCPLCNEPISSRQDANPDQVVNQHIENDCKSDLARGRRKTYTNRCGVKGCKQRELVPVTCASCKLNFCLRHRHENDHDCTKQDQPSASVQTTNRIPFRNTYQKPEVKRQPPAQGVSQRPMSEDEALAKAIEASLKEQRTNSSTNPTVEKPTSQEEEDLNLARALAASEQEERNRQQRLNQRQASQNQTQQNQGSNCRLS